MEEALMMALAVSLLPDLIRRGSHGPAPIQLLPDPVCFTMVNAAFYLRSMPTCTCAFGWIYALQQYIYIQTLAWETRGREQRIRKEIITALGLAALDT